MHGQGKNALGMLGYAAVALACMAGLAMGGDADSKAPAADFSKVFEVKDRGDTPSVKPKRTKGPAERPADEPPSMTCDGDQCWWTDLGKPNR